MKIIAFMLILSCLRDIIFPIFRICKAYKKAKEKNIDTSKISLKDFYIQELLNVTALIFFIAFILKY